MVKNGRHPCKYNKEWEKLFPITKVESDSGAFNCTPCARIYSCSNSGITRVRRHCQSSKHLRMVSEQSCGIKYTEPLADVPPKSPGRKAISKSKSRHLKSNPKYNGSQKLAKRSKNRIWRNKNETNTHKDVLKVEKILESYKKAYNFNHNPDIDSDLEEAMLENFDELFDYINEELLFLENVLKRVLDYKQ
ncbi:hypothetical protein RF11_03553 [Thelohanellus kitauei]|uniref:Uncharacterized protein n=1 Tax=Thelohanellus kitauei TaxID=669202 RepID=A0A0C2MYP5_THEKT|nr:hypothetical protein RF11_03553 [Thelohanellus kitauei]